MVEYFCLLSNCDGGLSRFGFVEFDDEEEAEYAIKKMDGKRVNGREIRLEYKRPQERNSFGGGSRGRDRGSGRYY